METSYALYGRRWYLLGVFYLISFIQGFEYNQFAPIYKSLEIAFDWSMQLVAMQPLYQCLAMSVGILPGAFLLDRYGLRSNMLLMASLTAASFLIRCVPIGDRTLQSWLINLSCVLNGLASSVRAYIPVVLSARWFHPSEHTVTTAVGMTSSMLGVGLAPLIMPLLVPDPPNAETPNAKAQAQNEYFRLTYVETALAVLAFIMVIVYYPDKPPKPPCASADEPKVDQIQCLKKISVSIPFWRIVVPFVAIGGGFVFWADVMGIDLQKNDVSQKWAGVMTFAANVVGCVGSIAFARLADIFPKSLKEIMIGMSALSVLSSVWIALVTQEFLPFSLGHFCIPAMILGVAGNTVISCGLELAVENLFPWDEAIIAGLMELMINFLEFIFMVILLYVNPSNGWMDWFLVGAAIFGVPFVLTMPNVYKRSRMDKPAENSREKLKMETGIQQYGAVNGVKADQSSLH